VKKRDGGLRGGARHTPHVLHGNLPFLCIEHKGTAAEAAGSCGGIC
jgi:hypothetical protein